MLDTLLWFLECIVLLYLLSIAHIATMAVVAQKLDIAVVTISFGVGKAFYTVGKVRFGVVPYGGYVRFEDTRDDESMPLKKPTFTVDANGAWDKQPVFKRIVVLLSGVMTLVIIGLVVLQSDGAEAFKSAFAQILVGAVQPFSEGVAMLHSGMAFATDHSVIALAALLSLKIAAYNLLPLPLLNGGQVLILLLSKLWPSIESNSTLPQIGITIALGLSFGWILALAALFEIF